MASLDALFADLLSAGHTMRHPATTPGDIGDNGDKQAAVPLAARTDGGDMLATSGDISGGDGAVSPNVATVSPLPNGPQSEQRRGLSPLSPMSPPLKADAMSPRPHRLTREQADRCHDGGWNDSEIETFAARVVLFMRRGISATDADDLAERLVLRDRDGDDRRLCLECRHLERGGRCAMARAGRLPNTDRRLEPLVTVLQRCEGFAPC